MGNRLSALLERFPTGPLHDGLHRAPAYVMQLTRKVPMGDGRGYPSLFRPRTA